MATGEEVVTLQNLGDGSALELFQVELTKLVANVQDVNMQAEKKRELVLRVTVKPDQKRETADVEISCTSKLAGVKPVDTVFYFGKHKGMPIAVEHNPKQSLLFDDEPSRDNIRSIKGGKDGGK